jgi:hypothetical protein
MCFSARPAYFGGIQANLFDGKFDGKNRHASAERNFAVIA